MVSTDKRDKHRFGIGEWYGKLFQHLTQDKRRFLADIQGRPKKDIPVQPCPFQSKPEHVVPCTKAGGVCSLRLYTLAASSGEVTLASGDAGRLRTVCPKRFEDSRVIYLWVSETLLSCSDALVLGEIGFLQGVPAEPTDKASDDVGRIDKVLVVPGVAPLAWCALEVQAVYFQGAGMKADYDVIKNHTSSTLPFPAGNRRPDYRSSGPKRLMPQLQIKVPSLRRWGKKMAVVVDQDFFAALAPMGEVRDISNCDIAWFVVRYQEGHGCARLIPDKIHLTTLEHAVEGLTAGVPVSLRVFEERIKDKLLRLSR